RRAGRRITCPVLVLWSGRGPLGSWYAEVGGPLALWRGGGPAGPGGAAPRWAFFSAGRARETPGERASGSPPTCSGAEESVARTGRRRSTHACPHVRICGQP